MSDEYISEDKMLWARATLLHDALEDMVWQFGHRSHNAERKWICTGGLSTLEHAFEVLGWPDPKYVEDGDCAYDGCHAWPTCGIPTDKGYQRLCGKHYQITRQATMLNSPRAPSPQTTHPRP